MNKFDIRIIFLFFFTLDVLSENIGQPGELFPIKVNKGIKKYSLLMILGGALGNFYDRIFYGAVPDFIDFHISNFHWFIFNFADIFITIGVIFMIIFEFIGNNNEEGTI